MVHPLRLSLCEIEYKSNERVLTVNLKLFLTDVNEALVFDPNSKELAFCQPNESSNAEKLLLDYLDQFFHLKLDGAKVEPKIKSKKLGGEGENTALWIFLEFTNQPTFSELEIKNAVFTDLFYDQSNIVYVHLDGNSHSLMLNKKTSTHTLNF